jgi:hypothetical protein
VTISDNDRIAYLAGERVESLRDRERAELDELRALLQAPATWEQPDPALEDRVVQAIAEATRSEGRDAVRPRPRPQRQGRLRSLLRRPTFAFGAVASAAAATVAIVAVLATSNSGSSPPHFAMVVSGTSLAPSARGSAELTKTTSGWRIELDASGLPHLQNGLFYQAWLKNGGGVLVPVGTFNDARRVTLWSGVPVTQYPTLTVTEQQANGNPASSGRGVLIGALKTKR